MGNTFKIKIFGTAHNQPEVNDLFIFNLHIISVDCLTIPTTSFDMFVSFYAFPFNLSNGSGILAKDNSGLSLYDRFTVKKPQVIHINNTTPIVPIQLFNCSGSLNLNGCNTSQINILSSLPPCPPNPEDIRIYSNTFAVPIKSDKSNPIFNPAWSNMTNPSGGINLIPSTQTFLMPIDVTIISDNCYYLSDPKKSKVTIYNKHISWFNASGPNMFGTTNCITNPNLYGIGENDVITIS